MACYSGCVRRIFINRSSSRRRPGPITTGVYVLTRIWLQPDIDSPRRMGPGLRRDDGGKLLNSLQHDHVLSWWIGIEPFHQRRAALEPGALIDIALVGEFIAVDRGRLGHQHRACDPHATGAFGRLVMRLQAPLQACQHIRMPDDILIAGVGIADDLPAGVEIGPGQQSDKRAVLSGHQRVLHHRRRRGDGIGAQ